VTLSFASPYLPADGAFPFGIVTGQSLASAIEIGAGEVVGDDAPETTALGEPGDPDAVDDVHAAKIAATSTSPRTHAAVHSVKPRSHAARQTRRPSRLRPRCIIVA